MRDDDSEEDGLYTMEATCCLSELLAMKKKYASLRHRLEELQDQVRLGDDRSSVESAPPSPTPPVPQQRAAATRDSPGSSSRYRQWYETIKKELAETARLLQERDEENEVKVWELRAAAASLKEELAAARGEKESCQRAAERAEERTREAEARREVAEAAAGALADEVDRWRAKAAEAVHDVQEAGMLRGRVRSLEEECEGLRSELVVSRQRHAEAVRRAEEEAGRVSSLCQELGIWQERARSNEEEVGRLRSKLERQRTSAEEEAARLRQDLARLQAQMTAQEDAANERVRRMQEEAVKLRAVEEEKIRLMERLEAAERAMAARAEEAATSSTGRRSPSPSPSRRTHASPPASATRGGAATSSSSVQQENTRLRDALNRQRESWEERVTELDAVISEQRDENDEMRRELGRLSQALSSASQQLLGYDSRLRQLEVGASRERDVEAARRQLLRDRMMIEAVLAKELGRVASSSSPPPEPRDLPEHLRAPVSATTQAPLSTDAASSPGDNASGSTPRCFRPGQPSMGSASPAATTDAATPQGCFPPTTADSREGGAQAFYPGRAGPQLRFDQQQQRPTLEQLLGDLDGRRPLHTQATGGGVGSSSSNHTTASSSMMRGATSLPSFNTGGWS